MSRATRLVVLLLLFIVMVVSCQYTTPIPKPTPKPDNFKAQLSNVYTSTVRIYWNDELANIQPLNIDISKTLTLTLHSVMEFRGVQTYTAHVTKVYTPGQLSAAGTGLFIEPKFSFFTLAPGEYDICRSSWWDIGSAKIFLIFLDELGNRLPLDKRDFACEEKYTIYNYVYLPIVARGKK